MSPLRTLRAISEVCQITTPITMRMQLSIYNVEDMGERYIYTYICTYSWCFRSVSDSVIRFLPILQSAIWDNPRRTLLALGFPPRDPSGDFRAVLYALYVDRRDNVRPVERKRETRELEKRTVFRVWDAEELRSRRRTACGT